MIKKRYITLLEIMIVIMLIGIITSVVGFNVKASLDKGKIFKTERAQEQIKDALMMEVADGRSIDFVVSNHKRILKESTLIKNVDAILTDGWNQPFDIKVSDNKDDIDVISKKLNDIRSNKKHK